MTTEEELTRIIDNLPYTVGRDLLLVCKKGDIYSLLKIGKILTELVKR